MAFSFKFLVAVVYLSLSLQTSSFSASRPRAIVGSPLSQRTRRELERPNPLKLMDDSTLPSSLVALDDSTVTAVGLALQAVATGIFSAISYYIYSEVKREATQLNRKEKMAKDDISSLTDHLKNTVENEKNVDLYLGRKWMPEAPKPVTAPARASTAPKAPAPVASPLASTTGGDYVSAFSSDNAICRETSKSDPNSKQKWMPEASNPAEAPGMFGGIDSASPTTVTPPIPPFHTTKIPSAPPAPSPGGLSPPTVQSSASYMSGLGGTAAMKSSYSASKWTPGTKVSSAGFAGSSSSYLSSMNSARTQATAPISPSYSHPASPPVSPPAALSSPPTVQSSTSYKSGLGGTAAMKSSYSASKWTPRSRVSSAGFTGSSRSYLSSMNSSATQAVTPVSPCHNPITSVTPPAPIAPQTPASPPASRADYMSSVSGSGSLPPNTMTAPEANDRGMKNHPSRSKSFSMNPDKDEFLLPAD